MNFNRLKKVFALGLTFALFSTSFTSAATIGTITGEIVNLREDNTFESEVVTTLSNGAQLSVIEETDGWFKVATPTGGVAYVTKDYLKITQSDAIVTTDDVNIRTLPSVKGDIIDTVNAGEKLNIQGIEGNWYIVLYDGEKAYVHKKYVDGDLLDYVSEPSKSDVEKAVEKKIVKNIDDDDNTIVENLYAVVNTSAGLNLRSDASTSSEVIKTLSNGASLDIIGVNDEWSKVKDSTGTIGFVSTAYVTLINGEKPDTSSISAKGEQFVAFAKQFIGTPYVFGGTSLTSGVDCSGFTYSIYKNFGITLNRTSKDQIKNGTAVSKNELIPGDLVFFNTGGNSPISHVGMYIGNGQYIHSTDGGNKGVTITSLSSSYSARTYYGACRVLK